MPRLAIDTICLDARLGRPRGAPDAAQAWSSALAHLPRVSLIDLPREFARRGIESIEVRSTHLPRVDDVYLTDFHATCTASDVEVLSLIVDDLPDLAHPDAASRYEAVGVAKPWLDRASLLQVRYVRLPTMPAYADRGADERLAESLEELAEHARRAEVRLLLAAPPGELRAKLTESLGEALSYAAELDGRRDPTLVADASRATLLAGWRSRVESLVAGASTVILPVDASAIVAGPFGDGEADPVAHANVGKAFDVLAQAMKDKKFAGHVVLSDASAEDGSDEWARLARLRDALQAHRVVRTAPAP